MAVWPAELPQYLLSDGFAYGVGDGRIRSRTDTGPGKMRRRTTAMAKPLRGRMLMDGAQVEALEAWLTDDILGGTLVFDFPHPVTRDTVQCVIGEEAPSISHAGGDAFYVNLTLEIVP